ncbi:MAG: porin [Candidatus Andeanibacterium colombiense]|uniref:Porin n=1 Tax=Candidatus Andeanibacterium colombiense TaxID=3121345 RepID=A0AAJ5X6N8_9SPHN|nr:MAG: porin [Sphingomonadaceae bacterium]
MAMNLRNAAFSLGILASLASFAWAVPARAEDGSDWSIAPRGRLQLDVGDLSASDAVEAASDGLPADVFMRRFFLGFDAKLPGKLAVRAEADISPEFEHADWTWTDLYLQWTPSRKASLIVGQTKPAWGLEEQTSDLFPTFMERGAIATTFGNERRVGLTGQYLAGDFVLQAGAYLDDIDAIIDHADNGHSYFGRVVYAPGIGAGRLHLGARVNRRDDGAAGVGVRYSTRPFLRSEDSRFVDTGTISGVTSETGYGLEFAYMNGAFEATGEAQWQHADRLAGLADPTFSGFYAEVGYFLTKGDKRGYRNGQWDRTRPVHPLGKGGFGAVQFNLRYDHLDLDDAGAGIVGGIQDAYAVGLSWTPTDRTRVILNYARLQYRDAAISAGGDRSYGADAIGLRTQFDF